MSTELFGEKVSQIETENKLFKYEDSGVFLGLVTVPPKTTPKQFYENELDLGYFKHRNNLHKIDNSIPEEYYKVKAYHLFGDFDLCLITLIDDLEFGNCAFQSDHKSEKTSNFSDNYYYQVVTGICPSYLYSDFKTEFKETFFPSNGKMLLPFIAISKFKINDGLLVGNGLNLLIKVNTFIKSIIPKNDNFKFVLLETFCNNEICVVFLSNSFNEITKTIIKIRESSLIDLTDSDSIVQNSLLLSLSLKKKLELDITDFKNSHLFINTHTIFGYDIDFPGDSKIKFAKTELEHSDIQMFNQWEIKPGHLEQFLFLLKKQPELIANPIHIPLGRGGLTTKYNFNNNKLPSLADYVEAMQKNENSFLASLENMDDNFNRFRTYINVKVPEEAVKSNKLKGKHIHLSKFLVGFTFKKEEIRKLESDLVKYCLSNVLQNRILRIFRNYNDAIQDPLLFSYFIELKEFLNQVLLNISFYGEKVLTGEKSQAEFHDIFKSFVDTFEIVYNNRYHQSYRMLNSTDFNLEFNGGIQQLISSYDTAYKVVLSKLGEKTPISLIEVSDTEGVRSDRFCLKLNYLHVFLPELFATLVVKEAANYYHTRKSDNLDSEFYKYFLVEKEGYDLRNRIRNAIDLSSSNLRSPDLKELLKSFLDYYHFRYFFVDRIYFSLGFNNNKALFYQWFFLMYTQNTRQYTNGGFSRVNILKLLTRLIVLFYHDHEQLEFIRFNPPSAIFNKTWFEDFLISYELVKALFNNNDFNGWISKVVEETNSLKIGLYQDEYSKLELKEPFDNWIKAISKLKRKYSDVRYKYKNEIPGKEMISPFTDFENSIKGIEEEIISKGNLIFEKKCLLIIANLKEGNIVVKDDSFTDIFFILSLCYSFITVFNEDISKKEFCRKFFDLNDSFSREISPILSDPLGGIFIPSHEVRKKSFKYRVAFLKSLWHFNYMFKKNVFIDNFNC